jgi:glucose-like phosphotransferase system IIB component
MGQPDATKMNDLLNALGGRGNIRSIDLAASRLRIGVAQTSVIDATAIRSLGLRGVTVASSDCVHVIVGPAADVTSRALNRLLA